MVAKTITLLEVAGSIPDRDTLIDLALALAFNSWSQKYALCQNGVRENIYNVYWIDTLRES